MSYEKIDLHDGEYTVVLENGYEVSALKNGEPWRDKKEFVGDSLILAMTQELLDLQVEAITLKEEVDRNKFIKVEDAYPPLAGQYLCKVTVGSMIVDELYILHTFRERDIERKQLKLSDWVRLLEWKFIE